MKSTASINCNMIANRLMYPPFILKKYIRDGTASFYNINNLLINSRSRFLLDNQLNLHFIP